MDKRRDIRIAESKGFKASYGDDACDLCGKTLLYEDDRIDGRCDRCRGGMDLIPRKPKRA